MSKYSYIHHTTIPKKLLLLNGDIHNSNFREYNDIKSQWNQSCKLYQDNPNHHFYPFRGMSSSNGDKYLQITEVINKWANGNPSEFHLVREIHKKGNHKFIEFVKLYECKSCGVFCKTRDSYHMPSKIFNRFKGLISKGEFNITETPLAMKVIGHH